MPLFSSASRDKAKTTARIRYLPTVKPLSSAIRQRFAEKFGLFTRMFTRILKPARAIGDMAGEQQITTAHLSAVLGYREQDHKTV